MIQYTDSLTDLNTLAYLFDKYDDYMKDNNSHMISLSISELKKINAEYGRDIGDLCLVTFSELLKSNFTDSLLVRRGGDEFVIVTYYSNETISFRLNNIHNQIDKYYEEGKLPLIFTFSSGIKKCDNDLKNSLFKADLTLMCAKKNGNLFDYYDETLLEEAKNLNKTFEEVEKLICYASFSHVIHGIYDIKGKNRVINEISTNNSIIDTKYEEKYRFFNKSSYLKNFDLKNIKKIIEEIIPTLNKKEKYMFTIHLETVNNYGYNLINYINDIINKNQIAPNRISISLKIKDNIKLSRKTIDILMRIKQTGIELCLENFNLYFNTYLLSFIALIDIDYVKIDRVLLIKAMNEKKTSILLKSIIKMFLELNIKPIFINVDSEDEITYIEAISNKCLIRSSLFYNEIEIKNTEII